MAARIKRLTTLTVATAGLAGAAFFAAPAAHAGGIASPCPRGYYGVEVYDTRGNTVVFACVRG